MEIMPLHFNKYTRRTATTATKCNSINHSINHSINNSQTGLQYRREIILVIFIMETITFGFHKNTGNTVTMATMAMECDSFTRTWSITYRRHNLQISFSWHQRP